MDFYLPSLNLAIEYNGDFWHFHEKIQERGFTNNFDYHFMKFNECLTNGIVLLYIWDSDWKNNKIEVMEALRIYKEFNVIPPILNKFTGSRDLTI